MIRRGKSKRKKTVYIFMVGSPGSKNCRVLAIYGGLGSARRDIEGWLPQLPVGIEINLWIADARKMPMRWGMTGGWIEIGSLLGQPSSLRPHPLSEGEVVKPLDAIETVSSATFLRTTAQ